MIVPRNRLIVWVALVLLPAALLYARSAQAAAGACLAAVALVLLSVLDAAKGPKRLAGFQVDAPDIIRMTVERPGQVLLTLEKPQDLEISVRLGLALPSVVVSELKTLDIHLKKEQTTCLVKWPCQVGRRGRYPLSACYLEIPSPWGLWAIRRRYPLKAEIRAYPNLVAGQQKLGGLFRRQEWGLRSMRRMGKGREFEQLRDYLPGDSYEDIDWKATARRRFPVTRVFQLEQAQEIYVILDASRLSTRNAEYISNRRSRARQAPSAGQVSVFERFITAALVMGMAANQAADRYGLLVFSDKPDGFIKAGRGPAHFNACREALYSRMPNLVSPDFDELFTFVGTRLRKRALLVFLTSLDDPVLAENFLQAMRSAAQKHILMVNMLRPPGAHPLFSSDRVSTIDGIYQHLVGHMLWNTLAELRRSLRQQGAGFHLLDNEALCGQLVQQYMDVKQRQIL
ncbi:MAG: DUF58 domain-containing protein [Desulfosarcinaceae bacterium]